MKLRMRHNSVRLRLTQAEVEKLKSEWRVEETVDFGSRSLMYAVVASTEATELHADWDGGTLTVEIPQDAVETWATTPQVGLQGEQSVDGPGQTLRILVEKDFRCLEERLSEDADTFPNPAACG